MRRWLRALAAWWLAYWRQAWDAYWRDEQDRRHLTESAEGGWTLPPAAQTQATTGHDTHLSSSTAHGGYRTSS